MLSVQVKIWSEGIWKTSRTMWKSSASRQVPHSSNRGKVRSLIVATFILEMMRDEYTDPEASNMWRYTTPAHADSDASLKLCSWVDTMCAWRVWQWCGISCLINSGSSCLYLSDEGWFSAGTSESHPMPASHTRWTVIFTWIMQRTKKPKIS